MKKISFLLIVLIVTINVWSQNRPSSFINDQKGKSASFSRDLTWQWDTIIVYDTAGLFQRWLQVMNDYTGTITTKTIQARNGSDWENSIQYSYTYTPFLAIATITTKSWNAGNWENSSLDTYYYNAQNQPDEEIYQIWSGGSYVNDTRWTWEYNSSGDNTLMKEQVWTGTWEDGYQYIMTYDASHNVLTNISQNSNGGVWENNHFMTYTYDANHHMLSEQQQQWETGAWVNVYLINYVYDANGFNTDYTMKIWDGSNWVDQWHHIFTYDPDGNQIEELWQIWDNGAWTDFYRNANTYDGNHNMLTDLWQNWNSGVWDNYYLYTYTYDSPERNSLTGKYEKWDNGGWIPENWGLWIFRQGVKTDYVNNSHRYEAHFTSFTNGVADHRKNTLRIYPNPAHSTVTVDLPSNVTGGFVTITDISGKELLRTNASGSKSVISLKSLPAGEYLLNFSSRDFNATGNLLITDY